MPHEVKLSNHPDAPAIRARRDQWVKKLTAKPVKADSFKRTSKPRPPVNLEGKQALHPNEEDPLEHFTAHPEELSAHLAAYEFIRLHTDNELFGTPRVNAEEMISQMKQFVVNPQHVLERSQVLQAVMYQLNRRDKVAAQKVGKFLKNSAPDLILEPDATEAALSGDEEEESGGHPQEEAELVELVSGQSHEE
jgi:hypothetical protein